MMEILGHGGPVLWAILVCFVAAFAAFVERGFHLHRARINADDFLKGITNILSRENIQEALTICEDTPGPSASVTRMAILHRDEPREALEASVNETGLAEIARMERRVGVVATVGQVAPLLGLLGTVLGMMRFLLTVGAADTLVQSADVLNGMWQALVTTAAGLTAAIVCYVAHNLIMAKIEALVADMQRTAFGITAFLAGRFATRGDAAP